MLWPTYCLGAVIVREDRCEGYVLERCSEFDVRWMGGEVLLMTNNPGWALGLTEFFMSGRWRGLVRLADVVIDDLSMLRGTHSVKNRFIARLRKFLRLLKEVYVCYGVCMDSVAYLLGVDRLREYAEVLSAFRGDCHRVRDKVHELLYPHIRSELERLKEVRLWFSSDAWYRHGLGLLITFTGDGDAEMKWDGPRLQRTKHVSVADAITILKKVVERDDRREQRLRYDEWSILKLLEPIPKTLDPR